MNKWNPAFYFITDSNDFSEKEFLYRIELALSGGVTLLQLREKDKSTKDYILLAEKVHNLTQKYHVPLIIDDRVDVAMAISAEGVHLGASDMPIDTARTILEKDVIIGATAKTVAQAKHAASSGADYLGVGAIFPTTTKVKTVLTSTDTLRDICGAVSIPVNAIGGLKADNLSVLRGIPIAGICVVSAVMKADNPQKAVIELMNAAKKEGIL